MKQSSLILFAILLLLSSSFGTHTSRAQAPAPNGLLPPTSIMPTAIPQQLPPGGSTIITSSEYITAQWSTDNSLLFAAAGGVIAAAAVVGLLIFRLRKRPLAS